jgi:hypothetical protein
LQLRLFGISVETITQPFLPYYRAPHNYFTMLNHITTFDDRPQTADWYFRFTSPLSSTLTTRFSLAQSYSPVPVSAELHVLLGSIGQAHAVRYISSLVHLYATSLASFVLGLKTTGRFIRILSLV